MKTKSPEEMEVAIDIASARERSHASGLLIDSHAIQARVMGGDVMFSQRVILTALIKGDPKVRQRILNELVPDHFHSPVFRFLFLMASRMLKAKGKVDEVTLYRQMESYVYDHWVSASDPEFDGSEYSAEEVLPGYLAVVDHVLAIEMPNEEMLDHAIALLQQYYERRAWTNHNTTSAIPSACSG